MHTSLLNTTGATIVTVEIHVLEHAFFGSVHVSVDSVAENARSGPVDHRNLVAAVPTAVFLGVHVQMALVHDDEVHSHHVRNHHGKRRMEVVARERPVFELQPSTGEAGPSFAVQIVLHRTDKSYVAVYGIVEPLTYGPVAPGVQISPHTSVQVQHQVSREVGSQNNQRHRLQHLPHFWHRRFKRLLGCVPHSLPAQHGVVVVWVLFLPCFSEIRVRKVVLRDRFWRNPHLEDVFRDSPRSLGVRESFNQTMVGGVDVERVRIQVFRVLLVSICLLVSLEVQVLLRQVRGTCRFGDIGSGGKRADQSGQHQQRGDQETVLVALQGRRGRIH
ncbi:hypothetical protein OGAPHI_004930 [Ogataea philodendri]|uniref:Uncharacterized protein n=1 Tax=Ogataea philodendri TaxID=1378263 RepID=A0A9P8T2U0_9ASCO|nr:uncharacterized protein OGAPHI_004930 [Ogataea philodendri]KAH3663529.1 hypothetical protein OGAPHI_004930 [Ogataea philodendri]